MQKCLIFSDSHGLALARMRRVIEMHRDAQVVFFLGDGLSEAEALVPMFPDRAFLFVRGNCDLAPLSPVEEIDMITLEGVRIVFTHGHKYGAKYSHSGLMALAAARGADVCLFGHTHTPTEEYHGEGERPFTLFNPGSIARPRDTGPSYGRIDVKGKEILLNTVRL